MYNYVGDSMKVSGSILTDKMDTKKAVKLMNEYNVDYIHVDIMDGKFVPNKSFTIKDIYNLSSYTNKELDIHLMVNNPLKYIDDLSMLNTKYITFHYEAVKNIDGVIDKIKSNGLKVGLSIKPNTSVNDIEKYLSKVDLILVMSVEPGKSGQIFMDSVIYKTEVLNRLRKENNYNYIISIDGGIDDISFEKIKNNVDMVVSSSYILSGNGLDKVNNFKNSI